MSGKVQTDSNALLEKSTCLVFLSPVFHFLTHAGERSHTLSLCLFRQQVRLNMLIAVAQRSRNVLLINGFSAQIFEELSAALSDLSRPEKQSIKISLRNETKTGLILLHF